MKGVSENLYKPYLFTKTTEQQTLQNRPGPVQNNLDFQVRNK